MDFKDPPLLKIREVTKLTGLSQSTIYQYIKDGRFPHSVKIGPFARWVRAEVESWLKHRPER